MFLKILLFYLFIFSSFQQNIYTWKNGISGEWSDPKNWIFQNQTLRVNATNYPQLDSDIAIIQVPGSYEVTLNTTIVINSVSFGDGISRIILKVNEAKLEARVLNGTENTLLYMVGGTIFCDAFNFSGNSYWERSFLTQNRGKLIISQKSTFELVRAIISCPETENYGVILFKEDSSTFSGVVKNFGFIQQGPKSNSFKFQRFFNYQRFLSITDSGGENYIDASIYNYGEMTLKGPGTHKMTNIEQYERGSFNLLNSTISNLDSGLFFQNGSLNLGGTIYTNEFRFNSLTGVFQFNSPLKIISPLVQLLNHASVLMEISKDQKPILIVEGKVRLFSNIILKLNYQAKVGDRIQFLEYKSIENYKNDIYIMGNRYLSSKFLFSRDKGYFELIKGFGFLDSEDRVIADCHYLGNLKNIEFTTSVEYNSILMLTFVFPMKYGKIGFGFDLKGNLSDSILFINEGSNITQYFHNNSSRTSVNLIYSVSEVKEVFSSQISPGIGPEYKVLNILIQKSLLSSQSFIYYAEISDNNSSHYIERYPFSILNTKDRQECSNFNYPQRIEVFELGGFIILLIIYVFLFILCCILIRFRPLNTRGISPLIILFILFSQLILETRNYFYANIPQYLCIFYSLAIFPLQLIIFITILLYFIRYFSVINLNEGKKSFYDSLKTEPTLQSFLIAKSFILKIISNPFTLLVINLFFYLFFVCIFLIIFASSGFKCLLITAFNMRLARICLIVIILITTFLVIVFDIFLNIKLLIRCKWIQYIFYNDPYFFRVQILLYIPLLLYSFSIEVYNLITAKFGYLVTQFIPFIILNTIQAKIILFNEVLFPLLLTIFELLRSLLRKKETNDDFQNIFKDEVLKLLFKEFCESEYSIENYLCYEDIKNFQKTKYDPLGLYYKYFNGANSVLEVNVPKKLTQEVYEKIVNNQIESNLFDSLESSIVVNLSDTYSRFIFDSKYLKYLESVKNQQKLVEMK